LEICGSSGNQRHRRAVCAAGAQRVRETSRRVSLLPRGRRCDPHHFRPQGERVRASCLRGPVVDMKKQYDFSKARRNPYARRLKRQITIRIDENTLGYFNALAEDLGIAYQTLINLYLRDCAARKKKPLIRWMPGAV